MSTAAGQPPSPPVPPTQSPGTSARVLELAARGAAKRKQSRLTPDALSKSELLFDNAMKADVAAAGTWVDVGSLSTELLGAGAPQKLFVRFCYHALFDAIGAVKRRGRVIIVGGSEADRRTFLLYTLIRIVQNGDGATFVNARTGSLLRFSSGNAVENTQQPHGTPGTHLCVSLVHEFPRLRERFHWPTTLALTIAHAPTAKDLPLWFTDPLKEDMRVNFLEMPPWTVREEQLASAPEVQSAVSAVAPVGNVQRAVVADDGAQERDLIEVEREGGRNFAPIARAQLRTQLRRLSRSPACVVMGGATPQSYTELKFNWPAKDARVVLGAPVSAVLKKPDHSLVLLPLMGEELAVAKGPQAFLFAQDQWRCIFHGDGMMDLWCLHSVNCSL